MHTKSINCVDSNKYLLMIYTFIDPYNASVENFSIVEKFSYLCAFQRGGRYARRLN